MAALTAKATFAAFSRFSRLSSADILRLNGVIVQRRGVKDPLDELMLRGGFQSHMDETEALMILGFEPHDKLDSPTIKKRYRRMMLHNHPDRGGSPMLSAKINRARELLERNLR